MNQFVYSQLQLLDNWTEEGDSGGLHGSCPITPGTLTSPMKVTFTPAIRPHGQPWDNAYILHRNLYQNSTMFNYILNVMFPTQHDIDNCNAFELDFQINDGKSVINLGWQALIGTGWRIWNRSANGGRGQWIALSPVMPVSFTAGVPVEIIQSFSITDGFLTYNEISVNGRSTFITQTFPTVKKVQNKYLNNAIQLDGKNHGAPITLYINEVNITGF